MSEKKHVDLGENLLPSDVSFEKALEELKKIHHLEIVLLTAEISDLKQQIKRLEKQ